MGGGSTDPGFLNWLRIGTLGPSTMLPPRIDASNLSMLTLTRTVDAESANLGMAASSGDRFGCALLDVGPGPGYQRIDYALTDAGFVSETVQGTTEKLIVTYASISWNYRPSGSAAAAVTGSGTINSEPGAARTSLKRDGQLVGGGVLALVALCLLGMLVLTLVGRRRRRKRYLAFRRAPGQQIQATEPKPTASQAATQPTVAQPPLPAPTEVPVPETLRSVHVAEFARPKPKQAVAAAEAAADVEVEVEVESAAES